MIILREQEKVFLVKRRHRLILFKNLLGPSFIFLTIILLMGIIPFLSFDFPEFLTEAFPSYNLKILTLYILSLVLILLWQAIFVAIANYYLDCWIITDERTIHTELRSLFSRIFSSVPHGRVQDITVDVKGISPTFFRYGDLQIQTAGKFQEFIFKQIPSPYDTKEVIFKAQQEYFRKKKEEPQKIDDENEIIVTEDKEY